MLSLTTHILDLGTGKPASGMCLELLMLFDHDVHHVLTCSTNADGRTDRALVAGDQFHFGVYEIVFHVGAYFRQRGADVDRSIFDRVPVRVTVSEMTHYHVPLLVSPYGYSTYRGS